MLKTASAQLLDSNYVRMYRDYVIINPWIGVPNYNLQVGTGIDTSTKYQDYMSNTKIMAGVDLTYRDLSLSVGIRTPLYANNSNQFGKSKTGSLSMRYTYKRWAFEGKYGSYSGFADATHITPGKEVLPFRKDLNAQIISIGSIYTFRAHKFSYGAAFNYAYRQLKSSWSPLLIAHMYGADFRAHNSVLDTNFTFPIRKMNTFNNSRTYGLGVGPGISGTVVALKRFFLTGMLCMGADVQFNKLTKNRNRIYESTTMNPFVDFRFAMGYNTNRIFTAITFKSENLVFDMYKFDINHSYSIFTLELGYRFNAPNWIRNTYDKALFWNRKSVKAG